MNIGHNSQFEAIEALPKSLQEVAELLGFGIVFALVDHFGGVELRIPHKLTPDHKLMVLGEHYAQALCDNFPVETILVPISLERRNLKRQVDALQDKGMKRWQIARELGITQRHVRRLANREPPADDSQFNLFSDLDRDTE